jgi:hypothetical protein
MAKKAVTFSIDDEIKLKFQIFCLQNSVKMSDVLEFMMDSFNNDFPNRSKEEIDIFINQVNDSVHERS